MATHLTHTLVALSATLTLATAASAETRPLICSAGFKFESGAVTGATAPRGFKVDVTNPLNFVVRDRVAGGKIKATHLPNSVTIAKGAQISVRHSTGSRSASVPTTRIQRFTLANDLPPGATARFTPARWDGACMAWAN